MSRAPRIGLAGTTPWRVEIERRRFSVMTEIFRNFPGYLAERQSATGKSALLRPQGLTGLWGPKESARS